MQHSNRKGYRKWTEESILQYLKEEKDRINNDKLLGRKLNDISSSFRNAVKEFGGWDYFFNKVGIKYKRIEQWDEERLITLIKAKIIIVKELNHRSNKPISLKSLKVSSRFIIKNGGYLKYLLLAGLPGDYLKKAYPALFPADWNTSKVIVYIQDYFKQNKDIRTNDMKGSLRAFVYRHGGFLKFFKLAKVDYSSQCIVPEWDKETVLNWLRNNKNKNHRDFPHGLKVFVRENGGWEYFRNLLNNHHAELTERIMNAA